MMRSSMLEVLSEGYIRAAKSKGLPNKVVLYKHAVRNALIPTITVIGINFGYYLGGAVIVESIFSLPGMGRAILNAVFSREFSIIQAGILLIAVTFTLINLAVDLLYVYIDPRIKYD
jgi:ABC-type dipeptide/oligopeptide/nickel transport system permease component